MSNVKKWIIILCILLIIAIIGLVVILINANNQNNNRATQHYANEEEGAISYELEKSLQPVKNRIDFYAVKDCINKYYSYYAVIFNAKDYYGTEDGEVIKEAEQQNSSVLYNMLDEEYVQGKEVTINNIKTKLEKIEICTVDITNMYVSQKSNNINVYVVQGILKENTTGNLNQFQVIVKIDSINKTFSIIPQEYMEEKYTSLAIGKDIEIDVPESIQKNENNTYDYNVVTDERYARDLFNQFKNEVQYASKLVYNNIDKDYKDKKFGTLENFQEYIKDNKERYSTMQIAKYQKTVTDDYTQYVCIDQNENYYIFRETAIMDYTLILDTYTIDLPEFIEKYSEALEEEKTLYNIQKVFDAINDGDYKYVYNKLDNTFQQNNFKNEEEFEKYIKNTFYSKNKFSYSNYQKSGNLHIYDISVTDTTGKERQVKKTFIMKLLEGTDFVMSFNVE